MSENSSQKKENPDNKKVSEILAELSRSLNGEKITLADVREALSGRSYGILMLVFVLPVLIPMPMPGVSAFISIPLVLITFQMMLGLDTPWFPKKVLDRSFKKSHLEKLIKKLEPYLKKIEKFLKPRISIIAEPKLAKCIIAAICLGLSLLIILPVPFGNVIPSIAIFFFSLGILQRDGVFVIIGGSIAIAGVLAISTFANAIAALVEKIPF